MSKNPKSRVILLFALMLVLLLSVTSLQAQDKDLQPAPDGVTVESAYYGDTDDKGAALLAPASMARTVDPSDLEQVSIIVTLDETADVASLEKVSGGEIVNTYTNVFKGVSMIVAGDSVESVAGVQGVTGIYLDELMQPDTDASPEFIGADVLWDDLGGQEHAGEGVVVGILDTGIWPEHPSLSDPDPFGNAYPAPPGGPYACDFGNTAFNPNDVPFTCNNKLIGAYDFTATYGAVVGLLPTEFDSARDANGHGTHTATTSAGNGNVSATLLGVDRGLVSGIAPRAHVIMYKVCGEDGCFNSDSIAAVDQAIADGVDVINFSISGGGNPYSDAVSQAFGSAYENGVFVAASAGNSGPGANTVAHREPWTTTVAASTSDRHFVSTATLVADNGDTLELKGATVTAGISTPTAVVLAANYGDKLCLSPFAAGTFSGQIVVCERGVNARVAKSFNVAAGGAGGMLLYNPVNQGLATDNHFIPSVHFDGDEGVLLTNFMAGHTGVTGTFTSGLATAVPGDMMASFSSRGGSGQSLGISKPDITAPGVQILAGHTPFPATEEGGLPGQLFQSIQGTSMSSPHIAGSAALIKAAHPDWTPGQIKSAMMLTANGTHVKEDGVTPADAFDYGSGRIDLTRAADSPLTIDETLENYMALEDSLWDANYPSLYVPVMPGRITVERTLHNELNRRFVGMTYVDAPADVKISVSRWVNIPANGYHTGEITVDAAQVPLGEVRFATIYIYSHYGVLRFPVTIVRNQPVVTLEQSCDPLNFARFTSTNCTVTATNTSFDEETISITDRLPNSLLLNKWKLDGATARGHQFFSYEGTLAGAQPPMYDVAVDPLASPFGYVPLAGFNPTVVSASDESITNFNVPAYTFAGETYSRIGIVSNGYIVLGGGTGADVNFLNTDLPDPAPPNNIVAPFWTDLNPGAGGRVLLALLTDGTNSWMVVEWEGIKNWSDGMPNTFQVWISYTQPDDISFVYGPAITAGDGGFLTVGAENAYGTSGNTVYFDGVGTPPAPSATGYEVDVFATPGEPGGSHVINFEAWAVHQGAWTNCAEMESEGFFGTNIACVNGVISRR
ncbi:MAG: S8 family serine peptidase [Anaerolineae bacterium]|nr:S8 family serine peptidase [Anaerolineae bacterium]